jgi:hypothetical protein
VLAFHVASAMIKVMLIEGRIMQESAIAEPITVGDNDFGKFIHLEFPEGSFNTIKTIVLREEDWLLLQDNQSNLMGLQIGDTRGRY